MSKPVFIIRFPMNPELKGLYREVLADFRRTMRDYHVFSVMDNKTDKVEFECYNPDNSCEITMQELEQKVLDSLK